MIVPITGEAAWLAALDGLPSWQPPAAAVTVVIAPHPDDETLAAGGLIAALRDAGSEVRVIAVTDGENCYPGEHLGAVRSAEQEAALATLGVPAEQIHRLHLPDSGLQSHEAELGSALFDLIPAAAHIVAPWPRDFHPDHEVCGRAASLAAAGRDAALTCYFFWTWHRGTPELLRHEPLVRYTLSERHHAARQAAMRCHRSQLEHADGKPILPPHLLTPLSRRFEVYLPA